MNKGFNLFVSPDKERHASWFELFFDLVFVISIAGLSQHLYINHSINGVMQYLVLFVIIWWLWMGITYYADQFNIHNLLGYSAYVIYMLGIIIINKFLPASFGTKSQIFIAIYCILRLILIFLYVYSYYSANVGQHLIKKYIYGLSLALAFWIMSLFAKNNSAIILHIIGMVIDLSVPVFAYLTTKNIPIQTSHMDERFGLFVIIVLGETVADVAHTFTLTNLSISHLIAFSISFMIILWFWSLYFNKASDQTIHKALRGQSKHLIMSFIYGYAHLLIFISIVAFGVGMQLVLENKQSIQTTTVILTLSSVIVFFVANKLIKKSGEIINGIS